MSSVVPPVTGNAWRQAGSAGPGGVRSVRNEAWSPKGEYSTLAWAEPRKAFEAELSHDLIDTWRAVSRPTG